MGAICGVFERSGRPAEPDRLAAMDDALSARAPLAAGAISQGTVGLAARCLAQGVAPGGVAPGGVAPGGAATGGSAPESGPWHDDAGRVALVVDGHVLNRAELARALEREVAGAAELIGQGYLAWGAAVFGRLEGAFAIALWDSAKSALLLARDGMGQRPLLYAATADTVGFASALPALAADRRRTLSLDPLVLRRMLAEGHPGPLRTPYAEVLQVAPGTVLTVTAEGMSEERFWQPKRARSIRKLPDAAAAFETLWTAVIGENLAGGARAGLIEQDALGGTLIGLALPKDQDLPLYQAASQWRPADAEAALALSRALGLTHRMVDAPLDGGAEAAFVAVARALDGQVASPEALPFHALCRAAAANGTLALADLGAVAAFAGDPSYTRARRAARLRLMLPPPGARLLARAVNALHAAIAEPWTGEAARFADALALPRRAAHAAWRNGVAPAAFTAVLGPDLKQLPPEAEGAAAALVNDGGDTIGRAILADLRHHLPGGLLRQADAIAHLHGLDLRLPFLDRRVLDFALALAPRLVVRGRGGYFLARLLRQGGAPEPVWRRPARVLPTPAARLLRGGLRSLGNRLLDREAERLAPYLDPLALRRLWRAHATRHADHAALLWNVLSFAAWLEQAKS